MTKLATEWVRTSDPVIRSPARYPARPPTEVTNNWVTHDNFEPSKKYIQYNMEAIICLSSWSRHHYLFIPIVRDGYDRYIQTQSIKFATMCGRENIVHLREWLFHSKYLLQMSDTKIFFNDTRVYTTDFNRNAKLLKEI